MTCLLSLGYFRIKISEDFWSRCEDENFQGFCSQSIPPEDSSTSLCIKDESKFLFDLGLCLFIFTLGLNIFSHGMYSFCSVIITDCSNNFYLIM